MRWGACAHFCRSCLGSDAGALHASAAGVRFVTGMATHRRNTTPLSDLLTRKGLFGFSWWGEVVEE